MLVSIALTAALVCTARAYTKRLNETRPTGPRPGHIAPRPRRDVSTSRDRLQTETSPPRSQSCPSVLERIGYKAM